MSNLETKLQIREAIKQHCMEEDIYYREVDSQRILTRCPCCGDSSNPNHAHFYIIIDPNTNINAGYICFKCGAHGPLTPEILSMMGIQNPNLAKQVSTMNKTSDRMATRGYMEGQTLMHFDFQVPLIRKRDPKIAYLEHRLGRTFTTTQLQKAKVVPSILQFLRENEIQRMSFQPSLMQMIDRDFIGFLSFGNSHLLLRDITGRHEPSWIKYPILEESRANRVFYTITNSLDPLSTEKLAINMTEGIMDILSVAFNLGYEKEDTLNVCLCGKQFKAFLTLLLDLGFCGSNITINIFADNDKEFNKKAKEYTDLLYFKKTIGRFKQLFGNVYIYYNRKGKDCGVPKEEILLEKHLL